MLARTRRLIAAALALLMTFPILASCSDTGSTETKANTSDTSVADTVQNETETETETTRADIPDNLPEGLNFNGDTVNVYHFGSPQTLSYDTAGELGGDVVLDAVYNRNITVEDRLGVKINYIAGSDDWNGFPAAVMTALNSGSSDYDVIMEESSRLWQQSIKGLYYNLMDKQYLDLDAPWWYGKMMEESNLDNSKRFFLNGDICLTVMLYASAMYFDKPLFTDYFGDVNALYDAVLDGTWTYDKFGAYCRDVYTDVNGNGAADDGDIMGFRYEQWGIPNYMSMSTGLTYITRDEEGFPVLNIMSEDGVKWSETLYKLLYTDNMSIFSNKENDKATTFINKTSLFLPGQFVTAHELRDVDFEYGILPYPKLDESLDYMSGAGTANGNGVAIPVSIAPERVDMLCAVLEALCAESYRKVTPAWYDTALKIKYSSGLIDAQMVDIIYDHINSPFIMMADKELNLGSVFTRGVFGSTSEGAFASYYESQRKLLDKSLQKAIDNYKKIES